MVPAFFFLSHDTVIHMTRLFLLFLLCSFLSGCCSRTTLILLPEDTGEPGGAVLQSSKGEVALTQPYSYTELLGRQLREAEVKQMDPEEFRSKWGELEDQEPARPQSFILNFLSGSAELTEDSTAKLPGIISAMRQDDPVEVNIIGHTDAVGDEEYNYRLSLKRARAVHDLIVDKAPWVTRVFVQSHGENDPLVPTADNIAEPRNRRVEILIR